ncbi:hypothetical protein TNIN_343521 [Trichonephila inaurata madagascariensis]|uniref:Uncharacterized protein n=1 Tax=Trichonephila inaurata madagascariensis TaxID=2747483 RepID=A0A8X6YFC6_9ARAC|nr:hypothetical protein TNIN_343521 [Trichonephila inaurata madagascariensis]
MLPCNGIIPSGRFSVLRYISLICKEFDFWASQAISFVLDFNILPVNRKDNGSFPLKLILIGAVIPENIIPFRTLWFRLVVPSVEQYLDHLERKPNG